jgi:hypothetical protein
VHIFDCQKQPLAINDVVAFVSGGEVRTGRVVELSQKVNRYNENVIQSFIKVKGDARGVFRSRYPARCLKLADAEAAAGIKLMVPLGRRGS